MRRWWAALAVPVVVVLAVVVGSVTERYVAFGDQARIELHARSVLSADTPLTGLVGRFNWNHPGPTMFWLLGPATAFAGHSSTPVRIGYALLCSGAIVAAFALAWRLGRRFFTVIVLATALALLGLPAVVLTRFWNPSFPVALVPLLVVLTAGVAAGRSRHLIGLAVVGTVMVQTHVGTALIVAVCAAAAAVWLSVAAPSTVLGCSLACSTA